MNQRVAQLSRFAVVMLTVVAWFSISNHCALADFVLNKAQPAPTTMHCHGSQPSPSKKSGEKEMPCCKVLRATVTGEAKIVQVGSKDFLPIRSLAFVELIAADNAQFCCRLLQLDTGPPGSRSFAELILQRSILAHAPPLFLS